MGCPSRDTKIEQCRHCTGEDYPCCEIYIEDQAVARHPSDPQEEDDTNPEYCEECGEELYRDCFGELRCSICDEPCPGCDDGGGPDESMDGDFDTGMASAGFGTDEDYGAGSFDE